MKHFGRSILIASMIAAVMRNSNLTFADQQRKLSEIPDYYSRGKGGRKQPRTFSGVARARRAAKKARNRAA